MFSGDQTHLRRYFATLGVAIAVGTLSLAGFFLKLQQDLLVTKPILAKLTPAARSALLRRQQYLSFGMTVLPWFVIVGFLGGVGLSAYGIIGWARRQRVVDEREDIGLHRERVELRQLTDVEKADKLDREAKESAEEPLPALPHARATNFKSVRTEIAIVESGLLEKLREIYRGGPSKVVSSVTTSTPRGRFEIDAAVTRQPEPPILFELKYASSANVFKRIVSGLQQLARVASTFYTIGFLVIVVSDDATSEQIEHWQARAAQMAAEYQSVIGVYVGRYSDFLSLPADDFAAQLGLPVEKPRETD